MDIPVCIHLLNSNICHFLCIQAVGEPPLFIGCSVFFAIKEAIAAARSEQGLSPHYDLEAPATSARIRMACQDKFTQLLKMPEPGTYKPWNIVP